MKIWFANLKIISKILVLLCLMGAVTVVSGFYAGHQMHVVDDADTFVIEHPDRANVNLAMFEENISEYIYGIYHLTSSTTNEGNKAAFAEIDSAKEDIIKYAEEVKKNDSEIAQKIDAIVQKLQSEQTGACAETIKLGSSTDAAQNAEATKLMDSTCAPALKATRALAESLLEDNIKRAQKMSDDATIMIDGLVRTTIAGILVLLALISALAAYLTRSNISKPIVEIEEGLAQLGEGNLSAVVGGSHRKDEIGSMARTFVSLREGLIKARDLEAAQRADVEAKAKRGELIAKLVRDFDQAASSAVSSVAAAATELSQTAGDMTNVATRTNEQAIGVAAASNQTSGTVQSVAAAVEEMSASVREISTQVAKSASIVRDASGEAKAATATSNEMLEAARSIGAVAGIIDGIAGQINLLALNATIESARAGEAGKGFAVVASEVKNLAGQTTKATEDIRKQLEDVQKMAENVANALLKLGSSVEKVDEVSSGIASAVEEQTAVTQEITKNMNVAASGVEQINSNIGGIQQSTESTSAATQQILAASGMLSQQAEELNAQVRTFLDAIKAA